jgi:glycosyltransferase involved in cell wall biosynthesis
VDYLLDVLAVARRTRDIRLEIFGDGGLRDHLEARTQELGLLRYTTFHGRIGRDRLSSAIDSCTLFAFPSRTEGQCLAALEVLSRGRPIVATPVGLFPEMLDDRRLGRIAPGNNPSEFAEAILNALSEVETFCLTAPIVQGIYANHFRRDSVIEGYIGVITELASNMRGVPAK